MTARVDVTVLGHLGAGNLGDELMLRGLLALLDDHGRRAEVMRSRPRDWMDPRPSGATYADRFSIERLRFLRRPTILCGGTHFHDAEVELARRRTDAAMAVLAAQLLAGRVAGGEVHLVGVGLGPLQGRAARQITRAVLRQSTTVTVRDASSQRVARQLSGRTPPLVPDLALFAPEIGSPPRPRPTKIESVVVVPVPNPRHHPASLPTADQVVQLAGSAVPVLIVPLNRSKLNLDCAAELARGLPRARVFTPPPDQPPVDATLGALARADLVISARFHGVIAAHALGRPTVAVPYHPKVQILAEELRLPTADEGTGAIPKALSSQETAPPQASVQALEQQVAAIAASCA